MTGPSKLVLVTGASGFVGRHLCPELIKAGFRVRATHVEPIVPAGWSSEIEWVKAVPIGRHTDWSWALRGGVSHVVHLAAVAHRISPDDQVPDAVYDEVNHLGTARLAMDVVRTRSVRRFLYMSSIGAVTSMADEPVNEQTACHPDTAYGRSKLAGEEAIEHVFSNSSVEWCIFRSPLIYGPGNTGNMGRLLRLLRLQLSLPLGAVRNRRDFLYVGNLVNAIRVALDHPAAARQIFCVGDGSKMSTPELMRGLGNASGTPVRLFPFPVWGLRLFGAAGSLVKKVTGRSVGFDAQTVGKLCGSLSVDSSHFRVTCGWCPPFSVEQGLRATVGANDERRKLLNDYRGGV